MLLISETLARCLVSDNAGIRETAQIELRKMLEPKPPRGRREDWHYDRQGYCDNPGRGY